MTDIYLHGFGSSGARFRHVWESARPPALGSLFLDGYQSDPLTGHLRWFPLSGAEPTLARHVCDVVDRLTSNIASRVTAEGIRLFGHSQGGMIVLELIRRGDLPIIFAEVFAAYLPLAERAGVWRGRPTGVVLHSSDSDDYIGPDRVGRTAAVMARAGIPVRSRVHRATAHGFSSEWLGSTRAEAA